MTRISYFRAATLMPILFPIPLTAFAYFTGLLDAPNIGDMIMVTFDAALIFGLPYLAVAAMALALMRNASEATYVRVGLVAPFLFAIVVLGLSLSSGKSPIENIGGVVFLGGVSVLVGYFYVGIAFLGLPMLETLGVIHDGRDHT